MFDFSNKKRNRVVLIVVVAILVLAMVVPMAFQLIAAIFG